MHLLFLFTENVSSTDNTTTDVVSSFLLYEGHIYVVFSIFITLLNAFYYIDCCFTLYYTYIYIIITCLPSKQRHNYNLLHYTQ